MPSARCLAAALTVAACLACATSPRLVSTWRDPAPATVHAKVLALAVTNDVAFRRVAEDELARGLLPAAAVAGYTLLPDADIKDRDKIRAAVAAVGADAALVLRVVDVEKKTTIVHGAYPLHYRTYGDYCSYTWPAYWDPGYVREDETVEVETLLYSTAGEKLVFAATTRTFNPPSPKDLVAAVTRVVSDELRKQGLLR
jgi:hypothetical protein